MNVGLPLGTLRIKQLMGKLDGSLRENYEAVEENVDNEFAFLKREMPQVNIDDIILIDEYNLPKLEHLYCHFNEIMFFPSIKKIRLIECQKI